MYVRATEYKIVLPAKGSFESSLSSRSNAWPKLKGGGGKEDSRASSEAHLAALMEAPATILQSCLSNSPLPVVKEFDGRGGTAKVKWEWGANSLLLEKEGREMTLESLWVEPPDLT